MFLSSIKNTWIKKDKDSYFTSLYSIIVVLLLFISHLILIPLTYTSQWHCPMTHEHASMPMSMSMANDVKASHLQISKKTNHHSHHDQKYHGNFICPLCSVLAISNPLLNFLLIFPKLTVSHLFLKRKVYQAQPPPILPIETQLPRAPPRI